VDIAVIRQDKYFAEKEKIEKKEFEQVEA